MFYKKFLHFSFLSKTMRSGAKPWNISTCIFALVSTNFSQIKAIKIFKIAKIYSKIDFSTFSPWKKTFNPFFSPEKQIYICCFMRRSITKILPFSALSGTSTLFHFLISKSLFFFTVSFLHLNLPIKCSPLSCLLRYLGRAKVDSPINFSYSSCFWLSLFLFILSSSSSFYSILVFTSPIPFLS